MFHLFYASRMSHLEGSAPKFEDIKIVPKGTKRKEIQRTNKNSRKGEDGNENRKRNRKPKSHENLSTNDNWMEKG